MNNLILSMFLTLILIIPPLLLVADSFNEYGELEKQKHKFYIAVILVLFILAGSIIYVLV